MADMRYSLVLNLAGNLTARAKRMTSAISGMSSRGQRDLRALGRAASLAGNGLDRLGNRYTALITGAAGIGTARGIMRLQDQLADLRVAANLSADAVEELKSTVYDVANMPSVRLDASQIIAGIKEVQDRSGILMRSRDDIALMGMAMRATGGDAVTMGQLIANAKSNLGINDTQGMMTFLAAIAEQGKMAKLRLDEVASVAPRITGAYAVTGRAGAQAGKEAMALAQVARSNVQSAEESATAVKAVMDQLLDPAVRKKIKGAGIQIMDPDEPKRMRAVPEILKDIVSKAQGDVARLRRVFTSQEAMPIINALARDFNMSGEFDLLDRMLAVQGSGKALADDAATRAQTMSGAITTLTNAWEKFGDKHLAGPIDDLANAINDLHPEQLDKTMKVLGYGAAGLGGLVVASKMIRTAAAAKSLFGGRRGGAAGMLGGAVSGATPVIVTNWPGGGGWGLDMAGSRGGRRGGAVPRGKAGLFARGGRALASLGSKIPGASFLARGGKLLGKLGGRAAMPLMALMYGTDFVGSAMAGDAKGAGRAAGGLGGGLAGAAAGAAAGSVIPGIGTLIGGVLGGLAGSFGGEKLGGMLGGLLKIEIESDKPTKVKRLESSSQAMDIDVDSGPVMAGGS